MNTIDIDIKISKKIISSRNSNNIKNLFLIYHKKEINLFEYINNFIKVNTKYKKLIDKIESSLKKKQSKALITILNEEENNMVYNLVLFSIDLDKNLNILNDHLRHCGVEIYENIHQNSLTNINILNTLKTDYVYCIVEGLVMSKYKFNKYKTKNNDINKTQNKLVLNINSVSRINQDKINRLKIIINSVYLARDLTNEPPNVLNPETFPNIIKTIIKKYNLSISYKLYNTNQLKKMNMNLLVSVGKSNKKESESKLLILEYKPKNNNNNKKNNDNNKPIILLGKGVTYDTGGLNLKDSYNSLIEGKTDMAAAAVMLSFLLGYSQMNGKENIILYIPIAENNLDSRSTKVGDIIKSHKGLTVEVTDTDGEGRLMMADCLSHIIKNYPESKIIDMATLTGQQESVSCKLFSSVMGTNNKKINNDIIKIGELINEPMIEIPILNSYEEKIKSTIADIKNYSEECSADMIISAMFLKQFINKNTNWTHIDIAGSSYKMTDINKIYNGEASGIGVRLLFELFSK